jgi:predicted enzyme related to lactoylglutathione lyase
MEKLQHSSFVIFVNDIEVSKKFYTEVLLQEIEMDFDVNVGFKSKLALWQRDYALNIIFGKETKAPDSNTNSEIYLETEGIQELWENVSSKNIEVIHGRIEQPWKQRVFRIYDPDKFIIEIGEPMPAVVKRSSSENLSQKEIFEQTFIPIKNVKAILSL